MADEGDKTCPLCAEEMDLTDQQLKPCKCGYDICVWCWHHIMDMAEKDDIEGRCPACRTPYNKKKIVETSSKCERLVAEMSVEKKQKSHKGKTKTSEGRKQLSSVRVIQRNLVYIVGVPLNLADEDLLQRKEYFGQYGKVLKVSISRTAAGAIQQFPNNTCSVYITYSKEDEAVRSIQSVHGYVLEGRPLRACFGTTKYCHAWLRSMPCTNPDCLYLHEFGLQEDSFTKDEIISEYTRCRVQQVTGAINDTQRRSGNMLPPAADDYSNNSASSWGNKPTDRSTANDPANSLKGSPPNSSSGRSLALPAAASWGTRASNSQPAAANGVSSNGPIKPKVDTCSTKSKSAEMVTNSSQGDETLKKHSEEKPIAYRKAKPDPSNDRNESIGQSPHDEERIHQVSSAMSSISIDTNHGSRTSDDEKPPEPLLLNKASVNEVETDLVSFNNQRLRDPEVVTHTHLNTINMPVNDKTTAVTNGDHKTTIDLGENSIISNILSMDFDPWDESLTSPQNLAKLLGNGGDKQGPSSKKTHSCNQSRFSFAREDDGCIDQGLNDYNGFSSFSFEEFGSAAAAGYSSLSTNKISVSRSQISAPPGFMGPVKAPPPGFASNDNLSGNHMFDSSSLLRKMNQAPASVYNNGSISELEFTDPAILAVGGRVPPTGPTTPTFDMRSNFSRLETENHLRLLVQRSFTPQSHNFSTDSYGLPARTLDHNNHNSLPAYQQVGNLTNFQQQRMHWGDNGWNEVQNRNDIAMAGFLRIERLGGFDKYYTGYEDAKFRVLSSGDMYNRTFGV